MNKGWKTKKRLIGKSGDLFLTRRSGTLRRSRVLYNTNGALKRNFYNGIDGIRYNVLNLPEKIQFMYGHLITYSYDASGEKRKVFYQTVKSNLNIRLMGYGFYTPSASDILSTLKTDYCAGGHIVYENDNLKYVLNPEGYSKKQSNGTYKYYYYAKDHLGNNRATFEATASSFSPQQEISYYPFGMPYYVTYPPRDGVNPEWQPYKFGGKEYDQMHGLNWYDFGARYYYGIVPAFMTMDPLAETYYSVSPYAYCGNNPVNRIDPTGKDWVITSNRDENNKLHINIAINGVLYNNSSNSSIDMTKLNDEIKKQISDTYSFSGNNYDVTTSVNLRTVTSIDDISKTDHVFQVVNQSDLSPSNALASATKNGLNIELGTNLVNDVLSGANTRTVSHELGHTGGLYDANLNNSLNVNLNTNLMTQTSAIQSAGISNINSANKIEVSQLNSIINSYNSGSLNKFSPISNKLQLGVMGTRYTLPVIYPYFKKELKK